MMYCSNCGKRVENGNFCPECGSSIQKTNVNVSSQNVVNLQNAGPYKMTKEDEKQANLLCFLSILFTYVIPVPVTLIGETVSSLTGFVASISGIFPLAGLVLMIVARVKYPESKFAKILMWVYIATIGISMLMFLIVMVSCAMACNNMDTSGCS